MKVISHEPRHWFLFQKGDSLFLDGNYNHSAFGYEFMIKLNEQEVERYKLEGKKYINTLVNSIQKSCPIHKDSKSVFIGRRVTAEISNEAHKAFKKWQKASNK